MKLDPKRIFEVLEKYEAEADQIFLIRSQVTNPESSLTNMEHIVCNNRWWRRGEECEPRGSYITQEESPDNKD